jgi:hypothetical protein
MEVYMLDNPLIWAIVTAFLGVVVVRKAVIIVRQGFHPGTPDC